MAESEIISFLNHLKLQGRTTLCQTVPTNQFLSSFQGEPNEWIPLTFGLPARVVDVNVHGREDVAVHLAVVGAAQLVARVDGPGLPVRPEEGAAEQRQRERVRQRARPLHDDTTVRPVKVAAAKGTELTVTQ